MTTPERAYLDRVLAHAPKAITTQTDLFAPPETKKTPTELCRPYVKRPYDSLQRESWRAIRWRNGPVTLSNGSIYPDHGAGIFTIVRPDGTFIDTRDEVEAWQIATS